MFRQLPQGCICDQPSCRVMRSDFYVWKYSQITLCVLLIYAHLTRMGIDS